MNNFDLRKYLTENKLVEVDMACPLPTQDLKLNTKNRDSSIKADYIKYGPLNVDEPGDYWEELAKHWDTTVEAAQKSLCGNCAAFDISPRMEDCMPGPLQDNDGRLGYCWMHSFKCHSARTCRTWAKGGPITDDKISKDPEPQTVQGRFGDIFNQLPCYITIHDRNLTFTSVNSRFKEDFGDEIGSKCYHVWRQRNESCEQCPVLKTFDDGQTHQMEVEFIAKSARRINILVWTSPVRNSSGNITHVMVMATNIDQVLDFQDHLSSLGLLIGSVSHGIKGLLTGLDGGLYLLDSGLSKQDNQQIKEGLDITKQMVARIRNMVLDILFYAKDRELNREQIDVKAFAQDVAGVIEPKLKNQSIEFTKKFRQPLGTFNVDSGFLHSAIVNILENAIDACIDDSVKSDHRITFVVEKFKDDILFEITDNGIGMDEKTVSQIFNMFFSAKGKQGTGLGLFITQRIVKQHGGNIQVESAKGKGTTLKVRIPISDEIHQDINR